jgi:hypothetical protein
MSKRNRHKINRKVPLPQKLLEAARESGIFVICDDLGKVDFLDTITGKSLGMWFKKPHERSIIAGHQEAGSVFDALERIAARCSR